MQKINTPENVVRRVYQIGGKISHRHVDDAVQDIAIRAWEHPERYGTDAQIRVAIKNRVIDYIRKERVVTYASRAEIRDHVVSHQSLDPDHQDVAHILSGLPEVAIVSTEAESNDLAEAYPTLSALADGWERQEIAEQRGTSRYIVRKQINREVNRLTASLN